MPSLLALVVLWIGSPDWAPWYDTGFHQGLWLDNTFLFGRDLAALLSSGAWPHATCASAVRARRRLRADTDPRLLPRLFPARLRPGHGARPEWHSNLAGGYFFMSGLYIAITCWALLAAWRPEARRGSAARPGEADGRLQPDDHLSHVSRTCSRSGTRTSPTRSASWCRA